MSERPIVQIKITSDPYKSKIKYYKFNEDRWEVFDYENSPSIGSSLFKEEYETGFFPFVVHDIVSIIKSEFGNGTDIELTFEGTYDEYEEINTVIQDLDDPSIKLMPINKYLNNASAIVDKIEQEYLKIKPIIEHARNFDEKDEINSILSRFRDVSKKEIPICVVGNYSKGKSMFINALIGRNILPSADEAATAKIYQIEESDTKNAVGIAFNYAQKRVTIKLYESKPIVIEGIDDSDEIFSQINEALVADEGSSLWIRTRTVINTINKDKDVAPRVKIKVPFYTKSPLKESGTSRFVIFDTPGSNSASNIDHKEILENAMRKMSNGLLIYIADTTSLDSNDNKELCSRIIGMSGIDPRFTMLVVNKVENTMGVTTDRETRLAQKLPRDLKTERLFYMSSIMGLGSKMEEPFNKEPWYTYYLPMSSMFNGSMDEANMTQKCYTLNILPQQTMQSVCKEAERCENRILANSGLYTVERELAMFADKYSPYNKCNQSKKFLEAILEVLKKNIQERFSHLNAEKHELKAQLDTKTSAILKMLEDKYDEIRNEFSKAFEKQLKETYKSIPKSVNSKQLFLDNQSSEKTSDELSDTLTVTEITPDMYSDIIDNVKNECNRLISDANEQLSTSAHEFCKNKIDQFRDQLIVIISEGKDISDEMKEEIKNELKDPDKTKEQDAFEKYKWNESDYVWKSLKLWNMTILKEQFDFRRLNTHAKKYVESEIDNIRKNILDEYTNNVNTWLDDRYSDMRDRLSEYNEAVNSLSKKISENEGYIKSNIKRRLDAEQCLHNVQRMLDWQDTIDMTSDEE